MRIGYISNHHEATGYSQAARDYILALDTCCDVVPVRLNVTGRIDDVPPRVQELEKKSFKNLDVVIQHTLPEYFEYHEGFLNLGLFAWETSRLPFGWKERINLLDGVIVINQEMKSVCEAEGVRVPIEVVNHACDTDRYTQSFDPIPELIEYEDEFIFYTVGEFRVRKNFETLLRAFHTAFGPHDPARLLIKTNTDIGEWCNDVKRRLNLRKEYKPEILISNRMTDKGLLSLHNACDCYVSVSHGEAWNLPAFDAMAMGKTPILSKTGGHLEYMRETEGWFIRGTREAVYGEVGPYRGDQHWFVASVADLTEKLKHVFTSPNERKAKSNACSLRAFDFSYEQIGAKLKEIAQRWLKRPIVLNSDQKPVVKGPTRKP